MSVSKTEDGCSTHSVSVWQCTREHGIAFKPANLWFHRAKKGIAGKYIGLSPSGKAQHFDCCITSVRIWPAQFVLTFLFSNNFYICRLVAEMVLPQSWKLASARACGSESLRRRLNSHNLSKGEVFARSLVTSVSELSRDRAHGYEPWFIDGRENRGQL